MPSISRLGILTGGGDAPGLNAVIRAVVKAASNCGIECVGLEDSFDGLIEPGRSRVIAPRDVTGILRLGGTILGTTNRGNPFAYRVDTSEGTRDYTYDKTNQLKSVTDPIPIRPATKMPGWRNCQAEMPAARATTSSSLRLS